MKRSFVLTMIIFITLAGCEAEATPSSKSVISTTRIVQVGFSKAMFTLQDMPSDWEQLPTGMLGDVKSKWFLEEFTPSHTAMFDADGGHQTAIGFIGSLLTEPEQAGFDAHLAEPEALLRQVANTLLAPKKILDYQEKPGLDDIGDVSAGWTVALDAPRSGIGDTVDVVVFRRDSLAAIVSIQYHLVDSPKADVGKIARSLDRRVETLATQTIEIAGLDTKTPVTDLPDNPEPGDALIRSTDEMVMVYVPGGAFLMGSDKNDPFVSDKEFPQHSVTLDSFWIDQTEVSVEQYALCVQADECEKAEELSWQMGYFQAERFKDHPVIGVNWEQANGYCQWAGGRLPTEAEWEYAACGPDSHLYPWGDSPPNEALLNYNNNNWGETMQVGSYSYGASWCGALDMAGNVWEWTSDWYEDYSSKAQTNPVGPAVGEWKTTRGGGYKSGEEHIRTAERPLGHALGGFGDEDIGFRCVWLP